MTDVAIAENLLTSTGADAQLIGARHRETGRIRFPMPEGADAAPYEPVALSRRGALWSWTVQRFLPKSPPYAGPETPATFRPYAIGYVELPGECIVETRIVDADFDSLRIGMAMALTVVPFRTGADGETIVTYAFRPAEGDAA